MSLNWKRETRRHQSPHNHKCNWIIQHSKIYIKCISKFMLLYHFGTFTISKHIFISFGIRWWKVFMKMNLNNFSNKMIAFLVCFSCLKRVIYLNQWFLHMTITNTLCMYIILYITFAYAGRPINATVRLYFYYAILLSLI